MFQYQNTINEIKSTVLITQGILGIVLGLVIQIGTQEAKIIVTGHKMDLWMGWIITIIK